MALIDFAPPRKTEPLSRVPSILIGQVCDDLETVMGLEKVRLDMNIWASSNGTCEVCAAGAVILCRAPRKYLRRNGSSRYEFNDGISSMMQGVDRLRCGHTEMFLDRIGVCIQNDLYAAEDTKLRLNRLLERPTKSQVARWITAARKLAARLKELGY